MKDDMQSNYNKYADDSWQPTVTLARHRGEGADAIYSSIVSDGRNHIRSNLGQGRQRVNHRIWVMKVNMDKSILRMDDDGVMVSWRHGNDVTMIQSMKL